MAAFEKVKSGISALDQVLDYIRTGDNVVWRVSNLDEFRLFAAGNPTRYGVTLDMLRTMA